MYMYLCTFLLIYIFLLFYSWRGLCTSLSCILAMASMFCSLVKKAQERHHFLRYTLYTNRNTLYTVHSVLYSTSTLLHCMWSIIGINYYMYMYLNLLYNVLIMCIIIIHVFVVPYYTCTCCTLKSAVSFLCRNSFNQE